MAEASDQIFCRICRGSDFEQLVAPCECKGSMKFVHSSCLQGWVKAANSATFLHCDICKTKYRMRWRLRSVRQLAAPAFTEDEWARLKLAALSSAIIAVDAYYVFAVLLPLQGLALARSVRVQAVKMGMIGFLIGCWLYCIVANIAFAVQLVRRWIAQNLEAV